MTLTIGDAPFSGRPGGVFNFDYESPAHVLYFEDSPRRVRVELGDRTVADSRGAKLMHETGQLPVYYLPEQDIDASLLELSGHSTHCPFKGDASYWSVRVGDRVAENAAWSYPEPQAGAPPLAGYVAFDWGAMDRWLEEDEEIQGHPRDPYTRIDVRASSRSVRVSAAGELVAETSRPRLLFETSLPTRFYVPREDVAAELIGPSETRTYCPYKGETDYWTLRLGDRELTDAAWTYAEPFPEARDIRDHVCFLHDELAIEVDGEAIAWGDGDRRFFDPGG